jgi:DNA-binding response OmpR family regulator
VIAAGPIRVDPVTREVTVHGDMLLLTSGEFDVLRELARFPYTAHTTGELLDLVGGGHTPEWMDARLRGVAGKLRRVGVKSAVTHWRGGYALLSEPDPLAPLRDAQEADAGQAFTLEADRALGGLA